MTLLLIALLAAPITIAEIHDAVEAGQAGEVRARVESLALSLPDDRPVQKAFALVLRSLGELDSAVAVYDRLLRADPGDDDARLGQALALSWAGRHDAALAVYAEIGTASEHYTEAVIGKGRVAAWAGRYPEALRWLAEAESLSPDNREVPERRAQVYSWSGNRAEAIRLYEQLARRSPENPDYRFALGQNYEWSDRPNTARRWYRLAAALAPDRVDVQEALQRTGEAVAPQARVEFSDVEDDDGGVRGTNRDYRFRYEQLLGDRFQPSASFAWSDNRRGLLGQSYLLVGAGLNWRPVAGLRLGARVQGDVLGFALKAATLGWDFERAWFAWSGEAGRSLLEPTQNIGAFSGATTLTARPLPGLKLEVRAARLQVIDDGNVKNALSAGAGFDILARPRLTVAYTFNFDDYRFRSPRYYSPGDLVTNSIGVAFDAHNRRTAFTAGAAGGLNANQEWLVRADAGLEQEVVSRTRLALNLDYAQVTGRSRYFYGSLGVAVIRTF